MQTLRGGERAANHATRRVRHARNGTAAKPGGCDSVSAITKKIDITNISISNRKIIKTKKTYKNLDEISLQKNYLRTIKYTLDYSDNNRSPKNLLKNKEKKGT